MCVSLFLPIFLQWLASVQSKPMRRHHERHQCQASRSTSAFSKVKKRFHSGTLFFFLTRRSMATRSEAKSCGLP